LNHYTTPPPDEHNELGDRLKLACWQKVDSNTECDCDTTSIDLSCLEMLIKYLLVQQNDFQLI